MKRGFIRFSFFFFLNLKVDHDNFKFCSWWKPSWEPQVYEKSKSVVYLLFSLERVQYIYDHEQKVKLKKPCVWYILMLGSFNSPGSFYFSSLPVFWPWHDLKAVAIFLHIFPGLQLSLEAGKLPELDIHDITSLLISDNLLQCKPLHSLFLCISSTQNIQNSRVSWWWSWKKDPTLISTKKSTLTQNLRVNYVMLYSLVLTWTWIWNKSVLRVETA